MSHLPLDLKITFYGKNDHIFKIGVVESPKQGVSWTVSLSDPSPILEKVIGEWMEGYLEGKKGLPLLPLQWEEISPFARKVYAHLANISFGETIFYSELAAKSGHPKACRAVGTICSKNPFPVVIPCHRVLPKNGGLGGYSLGCSIKEKLLQFERAKIS